MDKLNIRISWSGVVFILSLFYMSSTVTITVFMPQIAYYLLPTNIIPVALIIYNLRRPKVPSIESLLTEGVSDISLYKHYVLSYPAYKYVDIFQSVKTFSELYPDTVSLESSHPEDLASLLNGNYYIMGSGNLESPQTLAWPVDYHEEGFFPQDVFYVVQPEFTDEETGETTTETIFLRVRYLAGSMETMFEISATGDSIASLVKLAINEYSKSNSIYKNKVLEVDYEKEIRDDPGDVELGGLLNIRFKSISSVADEDIVMDPEIEEILQRNIIDFHNNRDELVEHGVPAKKAILFYGPSGTGKTFTCHYIHTKLEDITTIVVTGSSLIRVRSICNLAYILQPSLVIFEDVDLVFSSREMNMYSSALGDFMDELDGFQKDNAVTFILTTNSIERLEPAIRDRPGRISQCLYFGLPDENSRRSFIRRYLQPYSVSDLNIEELVQKTRGVTQAFMKELIYRAVQMAVMEKNYEMDTIKLCDRHFDKGLTEIIQYDNDSAKIILGYQKDIL